MRLEGVFLFLLLSFVSGHLNRTTCETEDCKATAQRILDYMDPSVKPCDDFYRFACGKFVDSAEIYSDKIENSSFSQVDDELKEQLKTILTEKSAPDEPAPYRTVKQLFSLCMDEEKMDARGVGHAVSRLEGAGGWPVLGNWKEFGWSFLDAEMRMRNLSIGGGSLFKIFITTDEKNTSRQVIEVDQPSLGLPREFLVKGPDDPIVKAYFSYMVDVAVLYGADRQLAEEKLNDSLLFELELAKITVPREERRDFERMYNPYELPELMAEMGWINWAALLESMMPETVPLRKNELIIVNEVEFFKTLEKFLHQYSDEVIANYMMWHAASGMVDILTNKMRDRHFEFKRVLLGLAAREPRWKECLNIVSGDSVLTPALSSLYVKRYFDNESKRVALNMTDMIREEMMGDIRELDWMDEQTRNKAEYKASQVVQHIGYPDELIDIHKIEEHYEGLNLNKDQYFEALIDLSRWAVNYKFHELRKPVNKTDWVTHGNVIMVNAFYNPQENSMIFPAGILQKPFFSAQVPLYVNYATIGFVVGHEITHGFDDMGSQFDSSGDLNAWREKESEKNFKEKTKCMIDQYSSFKDNQTQLNLNGINTQGENIADNGGIKLAYRAYRRIADQMTEPEPGLPQLEQYNNDQLFMLSMANVWCARYRPEALKLQIITDPHSPTEFRVNGVLVNSPEFSEVFQCGEGDRMNPQNKCEVW